MNDMKKIIWVVILLFSIVNIHAQQTEEEREYVVRIFGYIGQGRATCRSHGLQYIGLHFENGDIEYITGDPDDNRGYSNRSFFPRAHTFTSDNPLTQIEFLSFDRNSGFNGCSSAINRDHIFFDFRNVDYNCYFREYTRAEVFPRQTRGREGFAQVSIVPKTELWYADTDAHVGSVQTGCTSSGIDIEASPGFSAVAYQWEFLDPINTETITHPDYQAVLDALTEAEDEENDCANDDEGSCEEEEEAVEEARQAVEDYENAGYPLTAQAPVWNRITPVQGESSFTLTPEVLYPNSISDQEAIAGDYTISVRIRTDCNNDLYIIRTDEQESNILTVDFLPPPPELVGDPIVTQSCADTPASIAFVFNRNLYTDEELYINLLKYRPDGTLDSDANNILPAEGTFVNVGGQWRYNFDTKDVDITDGTYRLEIGGYDGGSATCLTTSDDFDIETLDPITFTMEASTPTCETGNTGRAVITSLDGGSGAYQFSANNGPWYTITSLPRVIPGLSSGINRVRVRDRNSTACESEEVTVRIETATRTVLNDVEYFPPATANTATGYLEIGSITGDVPFEDTDGTLYYLMDEAIYDLDTGEADRDSSGIPVPISGLLRDNLGEGEYNYRFYGQSRCSVSLNFTLIDADPITFSESDIQKQDPSCSSAEDGVLTLSDDDIEGGTPPYSISWREQGDTVDTVGNSITGGDGIYQVVVTDQRGIEAELTNIRFENIPLPVVISNVSIGDIDCHGEEATVTITARGGTSGEYQYALWQGTTNTTWQNSNVFLLNGNTSTGYRFRVRDRNVTVCTSDISGVYTIAQPDEIRITPQTVVDNTVFEQANGSITISVGGGTNPYNISWQRAGTPPTNAGTGTTINNLIAGSYIATVTDANDCVQQSTPIEITEPEELLVSIDAPAIICNAGIITITAEAEGGSETYTYQWYRNGSAIANEDDIELSTGAGTYFIEVNDGYTTARSEELVILQPEALSLSLSKTDVSCYGQDDGTIILNPGGGTRPYSFSIDNRVNYILESDLTNLTISNLEPETYEVWIRDVNGCEIAVPQNIVIDEPTEISITPVLVTNATTVDGTNGAIDINIEGGVGPFTYTWSKTDDVSFSAATQDITGISAGEYGVIVIDHTGCEMSRTFEVIEPDPLEVTIEQTNPILCYGDLLGELRATVVGGYPITGATPADYTYQWYVIEEGTESPVTTDLTQTSIDGLAAGTYRVLATDSQGASDDAFFEIMQPDDLTVVLSEEPTNVNCYGEATGAIDITVSGGPRDEITGEYLPYIYRWTKIEDPSFLASTEDLENISAGTYELVVIDDNLCTTSLSESVVITQPDAALEIYDIEPVNLTGFETRNGSISLEVRGGVLPYRHAWSRIDGVGYNSSSQDINGIAAGVYQLVVTDANNCTATITQEITEPDPLIVLITPLLLEEGIQCFGEETIIPLNTTTEGGVSPYSYEWYQVGGGSDPIFTGPQTMTTVLAGTYIVIVTDSNGNTDNTSYEVTEPAVLEIESSVTHLLCRGYENGQIDITVDGGVPPYSYSWSNGEVTEDISSLRAGNYTVTVTDANLCTVQAEIEIEQPPGLFVSGAIVRLYPSVSGANDGSITLTIGGGTPPYQYEWRDFDNTIQPSTINVLDNIGTEGYAVTITDANGCILEIENVDLYEPPPLEVIVEQVNVVSCFGDENASLSAIAEGGAPFNASKQYIYQWFDADSNLEVGDDWFLLEDRGSGTYYVIVSDAVGTTVTSTTFQLGQPDILELSLEANFVFCGDGNDWTITPQVEGGTAPYSYQWSNGETGEQLENIVAGTYTLEVTDIRGCQITDQITLTVPQALEIIPSLTIPTCYGGCDGIISLETLGGTPPYTYMWSTGETTNNINNLCAATYTVTVTDSKQCQITREILLDNPEELVIDLGEDVTLCLDQTIVLDATIEDDNATYQWTSENGFRSSESTVEVSDSGIYEVLVTDSDGCTAVDSIFIDTTTDTIGSQFIASTQVFVGEEFVLVENSDPFPDTVEWIFPEEAIITYEDDNYAEAFFETPGEYEVTLITYRGLCTASTTKTVVVVDKEIETEEGSESGGSNTVHSYIDYTAYPNPSPTGSFTVDVALSSVQSINVKVFTMVDNRILDSRMGEGSDTYAFEYNMQQLAAGVYFILLETSTVSQVRKLIIE